jgi:uncharacterized protein YkwD
MTHYFRKGSHLLFVSAISFVVSLGIFLFFLQDNTVAADNSVASNYSASQVIVAVNKQRREAGLPELLIDEKLSAAAAEKAAHMSEYQYFSHIHSESGKKWSDFILEQEYDYLVAGENLANGFYTVNEMVDAWMESPTHRENILNDNVDETGVGISYGELNGTQTIFVVQTFGREE